MRNRANRSQSRRPVGRSQHYSRPLSISRPRGTAVSGLESGARFGASQGFSGVGDLQSRKMRELLGRAAEDFVEPLDTLLMQLYVIEKTNIAHLCPEFGRHLLPDIEAKHTVGGLTILPKQCQHRLDQRSFSICAGAVHDEDRLLDGAGCEAVPDSALKELDHVLAPGHHFVEERIEYGAGCGGVVVYLNEFCQKVGAVVLPQIPCAQSPGWSFGLQEAFSPDSHVSGGLAVAGIEKTHVVAEDAASKTDSSARPF